MNNSVRFFIITICIGVLLGVLLLHLIPKIPKSEWDSRIVYDGEVVIEDIHIPVTIADSPEERELGLSGTSSLPVGTGKLFIFETSGKHGFWMKNMLYSLDIIWISEDLRVIDISENVTPESYPEIFKPKENSLYVLEVNSDFASKRGIKIGQSVILKK